MTLKNAKIALVFDWTTTRGGAEKVNLTLHKMFPNAPIFTSIYNEKNLPEFKEAAIKTSFIQKLPFAKTKHQMYLNLMPYAYESFDLSSYDIVISSSHSCAKGIITKPETMHICYCHTPMRYAWDNWHTYISDYKINPLIKYIGKRKMHKLRMWDKISAERVDHFIANSSTTKKRIEKYYRKNSEIIFPPIETKNFTIAEETKGYFLAVGRLTPYKKFDLIIETFNQIGLPLKIVGSGISEQDLRKQANSNIEFLGQVNEKTLRKLYSEAEALIFPQIEDFGITALESLASGRPVIALNEGGAKDSLTNENAVFFEKQTPTHLKEAIEKFQKTKNQYKPENLKKYSEKFEEEEFKKNLEEFIQTKWQQWQTKE
ncbi:glycosyltransferase family 4 protein [Candidatus Peregrinibacteria bacterium CG10_big_fil_rev_8_21_14_0_10_36_19]|nr:MAG: glycosyltransferase family 4 protein [Candidatus Peregrinibacteria bacterium CG10_big_fil_rev_8_21_14_0_10_36_19]